MFALMSLIEQYLYLYGFPILSVVLIMALFIIWFVMPPTGKLLLKKKLGILKGGKTHVLTAWDDRLLQTESVTVSPEGALEKERKKKTDFTFFLAKPLEDSDNPEANKDNEERDKVMLPPYLLDGVLPVHLVHISKAIATNPKVLTALRLGNKATAGKKTMKAQALMPTEIVDDLTGEKTNKLEVNVALGYDPVDIKKNFPRYWQQSSIDAMKKRNQLIGAEKARRGYREYIWPLVIVGIIVIAGMVITGLTQGLF